MNSTNYKITNPFIKNRKTDIDSALAHQPSSSSQLKTHLAKVAVESKADVGWGNNATAGRVDDEDDECSSRVVSRSMVSSFR
jgi:hypothetical protein